MPIRSSQVEGSGLILVLAMAGIGIGLIGWSIPAQSGGFSHIQVFYRVLLIKGTGLGIACNNYFSYVTQSSVIFFSPSYIKPPIAHQEIIQEQSLNGFGGILPTANITSHGFNGISNSSTVLFQEVVGCRSTLGVLTNAVNVTYVIEFYCNGPSQC